MPRALVVRSGTWKLLSHEIKDIPFWGRWVRTNSEGRHSMGVDEAEWLLGSHFCMQNIDDLRQDPVLEQIAEVAFICRHAGHSLELDEEYGSGRGKN